MFYSIFRCSNPSSHRPANTTNSFDLHALKEIMSAPKKRKSDIHIDLCARDEADHKSKKEKTNWHHEEQVENRRGSFLKGIINKVKSTASLKTLNRGPSTSKLETIANDTQLSIKSESSVTSVESGPSTLVPNIAKNAQLRSFVNRDSFTPVPPLDSDEKQDVFVMPTVGGSKSESTNKMEDSISISSHMSVDTIGSNHAIDEDAISIGSTSVFCTPSRNPLQRNGLRMSTRSVPGDADDDDTQHSLFRSLCNSARRLPNSKLEAGSTPMRRSMRMAIQKRNLSTKSMEDVPEEEEAAGGVITTATIRMSAPIAEEEESGEQFGAAKEFFDGNITSHDDSADEGSASISRLSTASVTSCSRQSIGRKSSIFRKIFNPKDRERRLSDVFHGPTSSTSHERRASIVSFTNDCSFAAGGMTSASASATNVSMTSVASTESQQKPKIRKKAPSTSNLTQRLSSVFRRSSTSTNKDDDLIGPHSQSRRSTLTGYSSISSGIGSIASGVSDQGYGTIGSRNGQSISRSGSKRDDQNKRERSRRLLDRIIISEIPAEDLLRMKVEQMKKKEEDADSSTDCISENELLNFDVVAVDVKADGSPFSSTAATFVDDRIKKMVKDEIRANYRPDRCGSVTDCEPDLVFLIPEQTVRGPNDSIISNSDPNSDLLRNVRNGLCKSIEEWKKISTGRDLSTMLIYPTFCQSEDEWDSPATIDAIFTMLDSIMCNVKRWRKNGKCILAGLTPTNVSLLQKEYNRLKESVEQTERDGPPTTDDIDSQSITSTSTVFGKTCEHNIL
ncbi:unnamed protein product [Caenorhabditis nigoni]